MPVLIPPDPEPGQPYEALVIDSTDIHADNVPVALENPDAGIRVISMDFPTPDSQSVTASSIDTDGDPFLFSRDGNRTVSVLVRCDGRGAGDPHAQMRERITELTQKVGKLHKGRDLADPSRSGTLKRTLANSDVVYFDILDAAIGVPADWQFIHNDSVEVSLSLTCGPFAHGAEEQVATFSETTLPEAVFTVTSVKGDVPALGRLLVEDDSGNDQWFFHWGLQKPADYAGTATASTTAALAYQAEALTPLNGATAVALTGASGGTALRLTAASTYQSIVGTDRSGTALSHVGNYQVWARIQSGGVLSDNAPAPVTMRLEWRPSAAGVYTANDPVVIETIESGNLLYRNLGQIRIPRALSGVQQWDGRIVVKTEPGYEAYGYVDRLTLVPVDGGYGEAAAVQPTGETPAQYVVVDDFTAGTATLAGSALPVGGTWSVTGPGTVIVESLLGGGATPAASISTAAAGTTFAIAGTAEYDAVRVQAHVESTTRQSGLFCRYGGTVDYAAVRLSAGGTAIVEKCVAGTVTPLGTAVVTGAFLGLEIDRTGRWTLHDGPSHESTSPNILGQDSDFAASGALDTGRVGLYDVSPGTALFSFWYRLRAWQPEYDAAIFASRQAQIHHNRAEHQDSSGSAIARVASYQGDYLHIPPAGVEGGTTRMIVRACRNLPDTMNDPGIDDVSGTVYATPRYWVIPE